MRDLALPFTVQLAFLHYTRRSAAITFTAVCTLCTIDKCPRTVVRVRIVISTPFRRHMEVLKNIENTY